MSTIDIKTGLEPKDGENGFRVKVARSRHCVKNCGSPGERSLAALRSMKGKPSTRRFMPAVEAAIEKAIAYYYENRTGRA
jgi:putative transposase